MSLANSKIPIKTIIRYYFTLTRMNKSNQREQLQMLKLSHTAGGSTKGYSHFGKQPGRVSKGDLPGGPQFHPWTYNQENSIHMFTQKFVHECSQQHYSAQLKKNSFVGLCRNNVFLLVIQRDLVSKDINKANCSKISTQMSNKRLKI